MFIEQSNMEEYSYTQEPQILQKENWEYYTRCVILISYNFFLICIVSTMQKKIEQRKLSFELQPFRQIEPGLSIPALHYFTSRNTI